MKREIKIILSLSATLMLANSVYAKEPTSLDSITVTAQKTEQNIQEVPISMTVFDEFTIQDNGIRTISDIADYVPNFQQFSTGGGGMYTPSMRGLSADAHTGSSTVGTYIDGIPYTSSIGNDVILENIERIEVLRGPQGTLYGNSAYAGVINIITKKPNNETRGKIKAEFGSDNKKEYSFNVSGPIVKDKFYVGVSAKHYEKDGYIKNEYLNKWDDDRKGDSIKLSLRATPTDDLDISFISSYSKKDDGSSTIQPMSAIDVRKTSRDFQGYTKSKLNAHALKIDYALNEMDFSSVTTYKDYKDIRGTDWDYSPAQKIHSESYGKHKNYSQEFKLNGEMEKLNWLLGLYFDKNKYNGHKIKNGIKTINSGSQSDSLGIFAHTDYNLQDNLILTTGIRYDKDNMETEKEGLSDKSNSEISPKIGLKHILNKNFTSYASISKGYKKGGYNNVMASIPETYDHETMWNYEAGFKSKSLEDKLTLNMSVFYMDIKNMQVQSNITAWGTYTSNAATATNKGIEIESDYKISDSLNIFANLGYTNIKFDKFKDFKGDYSGNYNPYAPKYDYSIGMKYRDAKGIFAKFDINGQSKFYADKANKFENKGFITGNAKIGYETEDYEIYLYCNNIADKKHDAEGSYSMFTMVSAPRETGISLAYRF